MEMRSLPWFCERVIPLKSSKRLSLAPSAQGSSPLLLAVELQQKESVYARACSSPCLFWLCNSSVCIWKVFIVLQPRKNTVFLWSQSIFSTFSVGNTKCKYSWARPFDVVFAGILHFWRISAGGGRGGGGKYISSSMSSFLRWVCRRPRYIFYRENTSTFSHLDRRRSRCIFGARCEFFL